MVGCILWAKSTAAPGAVIRTFFVAQQRGFGSDGVPRPSVSPDLTQPPSQEQLESLYRRYGPAIHRRCRRMLGRDAEDALHEIFLRVAAAVEMAPLSTDTPFWIQRIARNYCLNEIRNRRRSPELQDHPVVEGPAVPNRTSEIVAARDLVRRILCPAPRRESAAACLYYVDGLTQSEVGEVLGLSRRTIITYLANVRRRAAKVSNRGR